jgi:hypothetical protein
VFEAPKGVLADNAALAFSRDGRQLAFATSEAAVLWDLASGLPANRWALPAGLVQRLWFDGDSRLLHFQWDNWNNVEARMCCLRDLFKSDYKQPYARLPRVRG